MSFGLDQFIYAATFVFVLLSVEGVYLYFISGNERERVVNRRMALLGADPSRTLDPSILKRQRYGGQVSSLLLGATPWLGDLLWSANLRISPALFVSICSGVSGAAFIVLSVGLGVPALGALPLAGVLGAAPFLFALILKERRFKLFGEQLVSAIDLVARGLQAGHPVPVALEMVAREMPDPIGSEFGAAIDEINFGLDRDSALRAMIRRFPSADLRFFVAALEMQRETGGNLVEVLEKLTEVIRARANMRKKVEAVSAEGRLTGFVVGGLPFAIAIVINLINPTYYRAVMDRPAFWLQIGGAFLMWAIGIYMIWKLVTFKI